MYDIKCYYEVLIRRGHTHKGNGKKFFIWERVVDNMFETYESAAEYITTNLSKKRSPIMVNQVNTFLLNEEEFYNFYK